MKRQIILGALFLIGGIGAQGQNAEAIHGIKMFLSFLPAVGTVLSVLFISMYPLSESKMKEITSELNMKRSKTTDGD